jgi:hypothetical protein
VPQHEPHKIGAYKTGSTGHQHGFHRTWIIPLV